MPFIRSIRKVVTILARDKLEHTVPEVNELSDSEDDEDLLDMVVDDIKNGPSRAKIRRAYEVRLLQAERRAHEAEESVMEALTVQNAVLRLAVERRKRRRRTLQLRMVKDGGLRLRGQKRKSIPNARFIYRIPEKTEEKEALADTEMLVKVTEQHAQRCNNRLRVEKVKLGFVDEMAAASDELRERPPWVDRWGIPKQIKVKRVRVPSAQAKSG